MPAATAARHAARTRSQRAAALPQRRVSGPVARPRAVTTPAPPAGLLERLRGLPDHRVVDRLLRGRAWICLVGVALMGIVAMQVSLLKLNSGIGRAVETTATLERQNSQLEAGIARLASGERIRAAAEKNGMVTPAAGAVRYVRVRSGLAARAAQRMRPPSDAARELMANRGVVPGSLMAPTTTTTTTTPAAPAAPAATPAPAATAAPVTPVPTAAPVTPAAPTPAATAPSSGGAVAAAPTPPQG